MKPLLLLIILSVSYVRECAAQEKDIVKLLDAHDVLYFSRISDSFYSRVQRNTFDLHRVDQMFKYRLYTDLERTAIMRQAEGILATIKKINLLKKSFPYTYAQFAIEYYALKVILSLTKRSDGYNFKLIQYLDSIDYHYYTLLEDSETRLLQAEAGVRYESVTSGKKIRVHSLATDPLYGMLHKVLQLKFQPLEENTYPKQPGNFQLLLDAHDLLFINRTSNWYEGDSNRAKKVYALVEKLFSSIKDTISLMNDFPLAYRAYRVEHSYLKGLIAMNLPDEQYVEKLIVLEQGIASLSEYRIPAAVDETERMKKAVGVRRYTITLSKRFDVNNLIIEYNKTITQQLIQERIAYQEGKDLPLKRIDSLVALTKPYKHIEHELEDVASPVDDFFGRIDTYRSLTDSAAAITYKVALAAKKVTYYFKGLWALEQRKCDSALYFITGQKLIETLEKEKGLKNIDTSKIFARIPGFARQVADSAKLDCSTAAMIDTIANSLAYEGNLWLDESRIGGSIAMELSLSHGSAFLCRRLPLQHPRVL